MCQSFWDCVKDYQTLITGILTLVAAIGTALVIVKTAYLPIQHKKMEEAQRNNRLKTYAAFIISRNLRLIAERAHQAQATVKVVKASNTNVTDETRKKTRLVFAAIMDDHELMSLFPPAILEEIVDLRKKVDDHNFDMDRVGGSFGDDNFGAQIISRLDGIRERCIYLQNAILKN